VNGNAFGKITQHPQKNIALEITSFRQIPGQLPVVDDILSQAEKSVINNKRVNHGQMIGADNPSAFVLREFIVALAADSF
jgi:hypothetical protein